MHKGTYDQNGEYTGFYVEGIHGDIPVPNIELNEEEWQQALSKDYKVIDGVHIYSPYVQNQEEILESIRMSRNKLLLESDWTQLIDSPLIEEKKMEWRNYRQILRDITSNNDLANIIWPTKPE